MYNRHNWGLWIGSGQDGEGLDRIHYAGYDYGLGIPTLGDCKTWALMDT